MGCREADRYSVSRVPHGSSIKGKWQRGWVRRVGAAGRGSPPDVEAVVGVRGVLSPLKQRPLKLDGDLGDRAGR